jgi:hypothetical protein
VSIWLQLLFRSFSFLCRHFIETGSQFCFVDSPDIFIAIFCFEDKARISIAKLKAIFVLKTKRPTSQGIEAPSRSLKNMCPDDPNFQAKS